MSAVPIENTPSLLDVVQALVEPAAWQLLHVLQQGDADAASLCAATNTPSAAVVAALQQLQACGVVTSRVSDAQRDRVLYQLDVEHLRERAGQLVAALHPSFVLAPEGLATVVPMRRPWRVLFLCTHNSARSQLAAALLHQMSKGTIETASAGITPTDIHPRTIELLRHMGLATDQLRAKHVAELEGQRFDYVITVCDAAHERCPSFPHAKQQLHWSTPDPTAVDGTEAQHRAFTQVAAELSRRISYLLIALEREACTAQVEVAL